jgi:Tfp pilus assembly protein PilF
MDRLNALRRCFSFPMRGRPAQEVGVIVLLLVVGLLTFSNGLHNGFLLDDRTFFFSDMKMPSPGSMANYFIPDMRKHLGMDKVEAGATYYRPLAHIAPVLCYWIFRDDTFKHHLLNLALFLVLCFLIYRFILLITGDMMAAVLTAVLFCAHPVNGLMVDYITAQIFSIQLIMMLLCAVYFWKNTDGVWSHHGLLSVVFFTVSLLCHETAMAMPFYLVLLLMLKRRKTPTDWRTLVPFFVVLAVYALFRVFFASLKVSVLDKYHAFGMDGFGYAASFMQIVGWYLSKLVFPDGIVLTWVTPPVTSGVAWHMVLLMLTAGGLYRVLKHYYSTNKYAFGAIIWFLVGFLPVAFACLFQPKVGLTFEPHWMFFASLGFFVWLSLLIKKAAGRYALAAAVLLVVPLIVASRSYNVLWSDEKEYCLNWMRQAPHFRIGYFLLGDIYAREGNFSMARQMYRRYGDDWGVLNNLGLIDLRQGRYEDARQNFLSALQKNPNASMVHNNLGMIELDQGHLKVAEDYFLKAIELNQYLLQPRHLLTRVYIMEGRFDQAIALCRQTVASAPDDEKNLFYLVLLYTQAHRPWDAHECAQRLLKLTSDRDMLKNLAAASRQFGYADIEAAALQRINNTRS